MYLLVILFVISLLGITFMIGRKLLMLQGEQINIEHHGALFEEKHFDELKEFAWKVARTIGYTILIVSLRVQVKTMNFLKRHYSGLKLKIGDIYSNSDAEVLVEKKEVSKFLQMVGDYKKKVRKIKQRIVREERK